MTALTARRVRYGVGPDLICQPGPSPGIKTHSSPAAFPTTLSLPLVPFPLSHLSCTALSCLRPRRALPTPLPGPLVPTERIRRGQSARRLTLIRSTPRQHCLVDHLTRASIPDNDADEAPGVPAGRRRSGHATALDAGLLPFKLRPPIHHTSCLHRGRPRPRQHADWLCRYCVTTTPPCYRSPPRLGLVKGVIGLGADCAATRPMEKMPHAQPVPRSRMAQRLAAAGLK
jgi:hypothetical protein